MASSGSLLKRKSVLWVDDKPDNNTSLTNAFTELGIGVFQARDTAEAKDLLARRRFDVIITDMGRPGSKTAGLELVNDPVAAGIPTVVYSASWSGDHIGQEATYKVTQITNDPSVVYEQVLALLLAR